jgi:hypothetical protein
MKGFRIVLTLVSGAIILGGCSKNLAPTGHYQEIPITIDGNINDWGLPLRFSNPEYSMQYAVTYDDKNIYICVYSKDPSFQKRILKAGISIYFDTKGEKNKTMGLFFPIIKPADPAGRNGNPIRNTDYKTEIDQLLLQSDYYNTIGFLNMENGQYDINYKKNNIQLAIKLNTDSSLVYEAAIPVSYILGSALTPGYDPKNFSVGIIVDAMANAPANNTNRARSPYGGGGHMGGGMHGGGRNYGSGNNAPPKPEENWYTFRLIYKKPAT